MYGSATLLFPFFSCRSANQSCGTGGERLTGSGSEYSKKKQNQNSRKNRIRIWPDWNHNFFIGTITIDPTIREHQNQVWIWIWPKSQVWIRPKFPDSDPIEFSGFGSATLSANISMHIFASIVTEVLFYELWVRTWNYNDFVRKTTQCKIPIMIFQYIFQSRQFVIYFLHKYSTWRLSNITYKGGSPIFFFFISCVPQRLH